MEHHRLATSSELMNLSIKYQQIIKRETIRHYVLPEERTQYHPQSCQKKKKSIQTKLLGLATNFQEIKSTENM